MATAAVFVVLVLAIAFQQVQLRYLGRTASKLWENQKREDARIGEIESRLPPREPMATVARGR